MSEQEFNESLSSLRNRLSCAQDDFKYESLDTAATQLRMAAEAIDRLRTQLSHPDS